LSVALESGVSVDKAAQLDSTKDRALKVFPATIECLSTKRSQVPFLLVSSLFESFECRFSASGARCHLFSRSHKSNL